MKKILSLVIICAVCLTASAQTTASQKFLKRYSALIERINDKYAQNKDSVTAWKAERNVIREMYKARYRNTFTDDELEQYIKLNTLCKSKMSKMQLDKFSGQVDSLGTDIGKHFKRLGKKFNGLFEGLKRMSDENRTSE